MDDKIRTRYAYWRKRGAGDDPRPLTAASALGYARYEAQMAALDIDWSWTAGPYGTFVWGELDYHGRTIKVGVGPNDGPTDWGDCEPTEREREATESFYVCVILDDDNGAEVYQDGIGGVDVIDLEGYLQRDWEDAARYALLEYLLPGAQRFIDIEDVERAEWEARGTVTISC